jgi:lipid-binding SYLF domain-containing protein
MVARALAVGLLLALGLLGQAKTGLAMDVKEVEDTLLEFKKVDPGIARFLETAAGYAVFPTVTKAGLGFGGAGGAGLVFEKGEHIGKASLTQVTVGIQLGGQTYSEVIFFETAAAFTDFKKGTLALAAQVSAVAAAAGAAANANYQNGVAVFTLGKGGLMFEASVGGQKFRFEPLSKK